jgi:tetratricopeptide (TPR) repeat protein
VRSRSLWKAAVLAGAALCLTISLADAATGAAPQLAAAAPQPSLSEQCLKGAASTPQGLVEACTNVLDRGGVDGVERAVALYQRGRAFEMMGEVQRAREDYRAAADKYSTLISLTNPSPTLLYARGQAWHALGDADRALADYNRVAWMAPGWPMVFLNRGLLLAHDKKQFDLAVIDFDQALSLGLDPQLRVRVLEEKAAALKARGGS